MDVPLQPSITYWLPELALSHQNFENPRLKKDFNIS